MWNSWISLCLSLDLSLFFFLSPWIVPFRRHQWLPFNSNFHQGIFQARSFCKEPRIMSSNRRASFPVNALRRSPRRRTKTPSVNELSKKCSKWHRTTSFICRLTFASTKSRVPMPLDAKEANVVNLSLISFVLSFTTVDMSLFSQNVWDLGLILCWCRKPGPKMLSQPFCCAILAAKQIEAVLWCMNRLKYWLNGLNLQFQCK